MRLDLTKLGLILLGPFSCVRSVCAEVWDRWTSTYRRRPVDGDALLDKADVAHLGGGTIAYVFPVALTKQELEAIAKAAERRRRREHQETWEGEGRGRRRSRPSGAPGARGRQF